MKLRISKFLFFTILTVSFFSACGDNKEYVLTSENQNIKVVVKQREGQLYYSLFNNNILLIEPSLLGIKTDSGSFKNIEVSKMDYSEFSEQYTMLTGKKRQIDNSYKSMILTCKTDSIENIEIEFRAFNDGLAFRYHVESNSNDSILIMDEVTEFCPVQQGRKWAQPYDWWAPAYELPYQNRVLIGELSPKHREDGWAFPVLFEIKDSWLLITEADNDKNYAGSHVRNAEDSNHYKIAFSIKDQNNKAAQGFPKTGKEFYTPWRVIIAGKLSDIFSSNLVFNVSKASVISDTEWIKPGISSWSWLYEPSSSKDFNALKKYVDLSATMGWPYSLVDANWNMMAGGNIEDLITYAHSKKVELFVWYNSGGPHNTVTEQPRDILHVHESRDKEFERISAMGIKGVKIDFFESDKPNIMALYLDILESAAKHKLMVNFHGCTLPRGWQRTYPNLVSMESVRGLETYLIDKDFPAKAAMQNTILPLTRNVCGSMDYTPVGLSNNTFSRWTSNMHEIALPILFESGVTHISDKPEVIEALNDSIKNLFKNLPTVWDESVFIDGYPGKYIIVARRSGDNWYIAGVNGFYTQKEIELDLSPFNLKKKEFILFKDGAEKNEIKIEKATIDKIKISILPEGGFVITNAL